MKTSIEESVQGVRSDAERRPPLVIVKVKKAGELSARPDQLRYAGRPARPDRTRQGAEKGALIYDIEFLFLQGEEVRLPYSACKLAELALRRLDGGVGEIDRQHIVSMFSEGPYLVSGAAA